LDETGSIPVNCTVKKQGGAQIGMCAIVWY